MSTTAKLTSNQQRVLGAVGDWLRATKNPNAKHYQGPR